MLQAQQRSEYQPAGQKPRLLSGKDQRRDQDPVQEAVVLEMDVVDDQQARGQ